MNINFADWQVSKKVGCSVQSDENAAQAVQKIWLGEGTIEEMDLQLSPKKQSVMAEFCGRVVYSSLPGN